MTPSISNSSKRKTNTTAKGKKILKVVIPAPSVKKELPDIDLSAPMPPPSPSDDPLLLSGPILPPSSTPTRPYKERERREVGVVTSASPPASLRLPAYPSVAMSLPLSSSSPMDNIEGVQSFNWAKHTDPEGSTDLSMMDMDEGDADVSRLPLFNLNLADLPPSSDAGGWSDSDDDDHALPGGSGGHAEDGEAMEGEGEYTGKWKMVAVRTKLDPPSSATKERMEEWGRPITPFPKRIAKLDLLTEVHGEEAAAWDDIDMPSEPGEAADEEEEREVREISVPLDDEGDQEEQELEFDSQDLETPDTAMQGPFDFDASVDDPVVSDEELPLMEVAQQEELEDASQIDESFDRHDDDQLLAVNVNLRMNEEDEEEEREVRQMSVEFDNEEDSHAKECVASQNGSASLAFTPLNNQESAGQTGSPSPSPANKLSWFTRAAPLEGYADVDEEMEHSSLVHKTQQAEETFVAAERTAAGAINDDSSDDEAESDSDDASVVKITSADPRAAARAAAILKQVRLALVDVPVCPFLTLFAFNSTITIASPRLS
jgi:hypothetical protein